LLSKGPAADACRPDAKSGRTATTTVLPIKWLAPKQEILRSNSLPFEQMQKDSHVRRLADKTNPGLRVDPKSLLNFFEPRHAWWNNALKEEEARAHVEFITATPIVKVLSASLVKSLKLGFARLRCGDAGERKWVLLPWVLTPDDEITFEHDGGKIWLKVRGHSKPARIQELIRQCYQHLAFSRRIRQDLIERFGLKIFVSRSLCLPETRMGMTL
jgi:hypothetical protein